MEPQAHKFYTAAGYRSKSHKYMTESMEDYLEMIYRHCAQEGFARINRLAAQLNVNPSSSSKMAGVLRDAGLIEYEKYGVIRLTARGEALGRYLLHRHEVLTRFFNLLNGNTNQLEQVEQVEHFLSEPTIANIERLIRFLEENKW